MTLAEMFAEQDARTFEERRAEVVAIVSSAADFAGADYGLRAMYQHMCDAHDEREFDETFDQAGGLSQREHHALPAVRLTQVQGPSGASDLVGTTPSATDRPGQGGRPRS